MATFSLLIVKFISKSIGFRPFKIQNKLCLFHKNLTTDAHFILHKQEMQMINLKWLLFPY